MTQHKHSINVLPSGSPVEQDRCTVVISAHYQEWDSPTTHVRWAFDRLLPPEYKPYQNTQRVNPGAPIQVDIGGLAWGRCELVLGHQLVRVSPDNPSAAILQEAQNSNKIRITNIDGTEIGIIHPNRACVMQFSGPIFAEATGATAILHITALPI